MGDAADMAYKQGINEMLDKDFSCDEDNDQQYTGSWKCHVVKKVKCKYCGVEYYWLNTKDGWRLGRAGRPHQCPYFTK